jgi:hypothetical protein
MLLLWDLVTAIGVELVRHSQHPDGNKPRQYQPTADLCNQAVQDVLQLCVYKFCFKSIR